MPSLSYNARDVNCQASQRAAWSHLWQLLLTADENERQHPSCQAISADARDGRAPEGTSTAYGTTVHDPTPAPAVAR